MYGNELYWDISNPSNLSHPTSLLRGLKERLNSTAVTRNDLGKALQRLPRPASPGSQ